MVQSNNKPGSDATRRAPEMEDKMHAILRQEQELIREHRTKWNELGSAPPDSEDFEDRLAELRRRRNYLAMCMERDRLLNPDRRHVKKKEHNGRSQSALIVQKSVKEGSAGGMTATAKVPGSDMISEDAKNKASSGEQCSATIQKINEKGLDANIKHEAMGGNEPATVHATGPSITLTLPKADAGDEEEYDVQINLTLNIRKQPAASLAHSG